jgi:hypothetical protein
MIAGAMLFGVLTLRAPQERRRGPRPPQPEARLSPTETTLTGV